MTVAKYFGWRVHTHNIIERAFQLAQASSSVDEIRKRLRNEGYSNVDAHLPARRSRPS